MKWLIVLSQGIWEFTLPPICFVFVIAAYVARASGGDLYVTYADINTVHKFGASGADLGTFANTDGGPTGLAFDSHGNLYVASDVGTIRKFAPSGVNLGNIVTPKVDQRFAGLAFDQTGNLYAADYFSGGRADEDGYRYQTIHKFGPNDEDLGIFTNIAETQFPGLAFDRAGNLYVPSFWGAFIEKYSSVGADLGIFASTGLSGPTGLAFDNSGNLLVANTGNDSIRKFGPNGDDLGIFASTGLAQPIGLVFDGSGNLYVANNNTKVGDPDFGYTIHKFGAGGEDLGTFADPGAASGPIFLAFAPVPEPSSLLLAALGYVGLVVWRWRHAPAQGLQPLGSNVRQRSFLFIPGAILIFLTPLAAHAEIPDTILHSFAGGANDGNGPGAGLILSGSTLYGTTQYGGVADFGPAGTAFSLDLTSNAFTLLHKFAGGASDGATPSGVLALVGSTLYGTTYQGGASGFGTVFGFNTTNNSYTVLHSFAGGISDGVHPPAGLILSGSTLYGTTESGGFGGTIFSLNTTTNSFSILHSFTGGVAGGSYPEAGLTLSGSTLYGITTLGGASNKGLLFSLDSTTSAFTVLHDFDAHPRGGLTLSGSMLFGTTADGGAAGLGTVFSFDIASNAYSILHSFAGGPGDGNRPGAGLIVSSSMLYGTTASGGALLPDGTASHGTVFSLDTANNAFTLLHSFAGGPSDGASPSADLTLSGSTLYGTTFSGGASGEGVIFALSVPEPSSVILAAFGFVAFIARRKFCSFKIPLEID